MDNKERYCEPFNMSPREFQDYKDWKKTRFFLYIVAMIGVTIFTERVVGWVVMTLLYLFVCWNEKKCEEQWINYGNVKEEDLN